MARAAAVLRALGTERAGALVGLSVALALYTAAAGRLWEAGLRWDVAFLVLVLVPGFFLVPWLLLPLAFVRGLLPIALALIVLALLLRAAELDVLFNFTKLLALILLGFWFLTYFEAVSWAVLIAVVIPFVDAISVWRGPTDYIVSEQPSVFNDVSDRVPDPRRERERQHRPAGHPLLLALPRGRPALRPARGVDVDRDGRAPRPDARDHRNDGCGRPARPAGDLRRLPAAERRPALA